MRRAENIVVIVSLLLFWSDGFWHCFTGIDLARMPSWGSTEEQKWRRALLIRDLPPTTVQHLAFMTDGYEPQE